MHCHIMGKICKRNANVYMDKSAHVLIINTIEVLRLQNNMFLKIYDKDLFLGKKKENWKTKQNKSPHESDHNENDLIKTGRLF
jgi:hypothetical protein